MSFPKLRTGAVTQYPSARRLTYATCVTKFVDGREQRFREIGRAIQSWLIQLHHLSDEEMRDVAAFFDSMQGRFGSFSFTDPWDETEYPNCSFDQDAFSMRALEEGRHQGYLVIRNNTP